MAIILRTHAHSSLSELPPERLFTFLDLADETGVYAAAAIGERPGCLELHLTALRWGPRSARALRQDLEWLKQLARSRGHGRIVGHTIAAGLDVDRRWFKFARAFGFTRQCVHQTAELVLDQDEAHPLSTGNSCPFPGQNHGRFVRAQKPGLQ